MSNENITPDQPDFIKAHFADTDDVDGHAMAEGKRPAPEAHRAADTEDDVEGHAHRGPASHRVADDSSEQPGFIKSRFADDEDDVEGHSHRGPQDVRRPGVSPRPDSPTDRAPSHLTGL